MDFFVYLCKRKEGLVKVRLALVKSSLVFVLVKGLPFGSPLHFSYHFFTFFFPP